LDFLPKELFLAGILQIMTVSGEGNAICGRASHVAVFFTRFLRVKQEKLTFKAASEICSQKPAFSA
jgi:hypothetical protein